MIVGKKIAAKLNAVFKVIQTLFDILKTRKLIIILAPIKISS
jgi:hypothetical protein